MTGGNRQQPLGCLPQSPAWVQCRDLAQEGRHIWVLGRVPRQGRFALVRLTPPGTAQHLCSAWQ